MTAIVNKNPRSNRASIRLHTFQFDFDPVGLPTDVIAKQRRRLVKIDNQNIDVPIVVEIPEGATSATVRRFHTRTGSLDEFFENAFAQIPENSARSFAGVLRQCSSNLGVNMAGYHEQIWKSVVVQVDDSGSPTHVASFNSQVRRSGRILKISLSIVVIKDV